MLSVGLSLGTFFFGGGFVFYELFPTGVVFIKPKVVSKPEKQNHGLGWVRIIFPVALITGGTKKKNMPFWQRKTQGGAEKQQKKKNFSGFSLFNGNWN